MSDAYNRGNAVDADSGQNDKAKAAGGHMGTRPRSLQDSAEEYIELLLLLHDPSENPRLRYAVGILVRDLKGMAIIVDAFLAGEKPKRKMGRHARAGERERQFGFDLECYTETEQLHHDGLIWEEAFEEMADELNVAPETVRKARYRAKKLLSQMAAQCSAAWRRSSGMEPNDGAK